MTGEPDGGPLSPGVELTQRSLARAFAAAREDGLPWIDEEHVEEYVRRGYTDHVGDLVADGLEREPETSRYGGGATYARVLEFGEAFDGLHLRITVELVRMATDDDAEEPRDGP